MIIAIIPVCDYPSRIQPRKEKVMSTEAKTNYASTLILVLLGLLALYAGGGWLMVLVPAAIVVWYSGARGTFKRGRN